MSKPKKFLVVGRTSSGKTSITRATADKLGLTVVQSYTTRAKRNKNDTDHIFIKTEEVSKYQDDIVAYTKIGDVEYFVTREILDKSDIYVIDPRGVDYLKTHCKDYEYIEIYIRTPNSVSKEFSRRRGDKTSVYKQRCEDENEEFKEYERRSNFHYHLLNIGTFDEAVEKMSGWIQRERERS